MNSDTKHYKIIRTPDYKESEISEYFPIPWNSVPQSILNLPGSVYTVYEPDGYDAQYVILVKKCRERKSKGIAINDDIIVYV